MNITLALKKGEQHLIYLSQRNFPDCIKGYKVHVKKLEGNTAVLVDLNDKNKEKTFYVQKVLEVLDSEISHDELAQRVQWHQQNLFINYKPMTSFALSKGLPLMKKKCSGHYDGNTIDLNLGNYPADLTRDAHIFSFLCAILKDNSNYNLSDCKKFNDFAKSVLPEKFEDDKDYFKYSFDAEMKQDYLYDFKDTVEMWQGDIKEIKNDKDLSPSEKKDEIENQGLENKLRIAKEELAIARKDLRGMLAGWFVYEFYRKHKSNLFYMLFDIYDVLDLRKIDGNENKM